MAARDRGRPPLLVTPIDYGCLTAGTRRDLGDHVRTSSSSRRARCSPRSSALQLRPLEVLPPHRTYEVDTNARTMLSATGAARRPRPV
ncbi:hypothetical protein HBB16_09615 [Pseudonocardia sp. MCCB 268]|nr:hypothetical protein [Pseudonocardia cytotoxica]